MATVGSGLVWDRCERRVRWRQSLVKGRQDRVRIVWCRCRRRLNEWVNNARLRLSPVAVIGLGVLLPLVVCALLSGLRDQIENTSAALILVLVVGAASTWNRLAGLSAAVVSAVAFDFCLTIPYQDLRIHARSDVETTVLLVLIGAAVTELALWGRRQQARASEQRGYLDGILQTTGTLATSSSAGLVVELVERRLEDLLDLDRATFVRQWPAEGPRFWSATAP